MLLPAWPTQACGGLKETSFLLTLSEPAFPSYLPFTYTPLSLFSLYLLVFPFLSFSSPFFFLAASTFFLLSLFTVIQIGSIRSRAPQSRHVLFTINRVWPVFLCKWIISLPGVSQKTTTLEVYHWAKDVEKHRSEAKYMDLLRKTKALSGIFKLCQSSPNANRYVDNNGAKKKKHWKT